MAFFNFLRKEPTDKEVSELRDAEAVALERRQQRIERRVSSLETRVAIIERRPPRQPSGG